MNFERADIRSIAQSKVQTAVVGRDIAAAGENILSLTHPVGRKVRCGAGGVARAFRPTHELDFDPMMMVRIHVAQQNGRTIDGIDDHVDLAIVEEVAECRAARRDHVGKPRSH